MVALDLFYGKVKFGHLGFCMGKRQSCGFMLNYYSQPMTFKVDICNHLKELL